MPRAREYLDSYQGDNLADSGEPYPLLLVRPDGVEAYYVAREAMTSWGSEFGYELIDQDWKLEFREPAPAMVEAMRLAVDEARMRQQALARSAPRYFSEKKGAQWYRAAPSGGVVQESGPSDDDADRSRNGWGGRRGGGGGGGGAAAAVVTPIKGMVAPVIGMAKATGAEPLRVDIHRTTETAAAPERAKPAPVPIAKPS